MEQLAKKQHSSVNKDKKGPDDKCKHENKSQELILDSNLQERSLEYVLKESENRDENEKLNILAIKYNELFEDFQKLYKKTDTLETQCKDVQYETQKYKNDLDKTTLAKTRLESLCRELQKQNKSIKVYFKGYISITKSVLQ